MKDIILGSHIWFARAGATIGAETVDADTLPDFAATKEEWLQLPTVEQWEPRRNSNVVKRRAHVIGKGWQVRKKFMLSNEVTHAFALQEFGALEWELLMGASAITPVTGAYDPNSRSEDIEGWLHMDNYNNQEGGKIHATDIWVGLSIEPFQFGENLNPHTLMAELLANELNEGFLTMAAFE